MNWSAQFFCIDTHNRPTAHKHARLFRCHHASGPILKACDSQPAKPVTPAPRSDPLASACYHVCASAPACDRQAARAAPSPRPACEGRLKTLLASDPVADATLVIVLLCLPWVGATPAQSFRFAGVAFLLLPFGYGHATKCAVVCGKAWSLPLSTDVPLVVGSCGPCCQLCSLLPKLLGA